MSNLIADSKTSFFPTEYLKTDKQSDSGCRNYGALTLSKYGVQLIDVYTDDIHLYGLLTVHCRIGPALDYYVSYSTELKLLHKTQQLSLYSFNRLGTLDEPIVIGEYVLIEYHSSSSKDHYCIVKEVAYD